MVEWQRYQKSNKSSSAKQCLVILIWDIKKKIYFNLALETVTLFLQFNFLQIFNHN